VRILHLIDSLDPAHGGPTAVVRDLASHQRRLGHHVAVAFHDDASKRARVHQLLAVLPGHLCPDVVRLPSGGAPRGATRAGRLCGTAALALPWLVNSPRLSRMLREAVERSDVVHIHGLWEVVCKTAASLARKRGTPFVLTPHGLLHPWSLSQKPIKKKIALALGVRKMLETAAFVHSLNDAEGEFVRRVASVRRCEVIGNGVDLSEVDGRPPRGAFRRAHERIGGRPTVLFLGRLHYMKGVDLLIEAFIHLRSEIPEALLVIVGPDGGELSRLLDRAGQAGIGDSVMYTGPLYGNDKYAAIADANCFVLPSRREGFSVAILEAMACGTPVVISKDCFFPEAAERGAAVCVGLDARELASALVSVLSDESLQERMGKSGRELVIEKYTWTRIAARMIEAYRAAGANGQS